MNTLNSLYAEAEKGSCSTYCEGCMACLTAYIIYFCAETHYEKCLKKVSRFVHEQNEQVWTKHGLLITDPVERGLRWAPGIHWMMEYLIVTALYLQGCGDLPTD